MRLRHISLILVVILAVLFRYHAHALDLDDYDDYDNDDYDDYDDDDDDDVVVVPAVPTQHVVEEKKEIQIDAGKPCIVDDENNPLPGQQCALDYTQNHKAAVLLPPKDAMADLETPQVGKTKDSSGKEIDIFSADAISEAEKDPHTKSLLDEIVTKEKTLRRDQEWADRMKQEVVALKTKIDNVEAYVKSHQRDLDQLKASIAIRQKAKKKMEIQEKLGDAMGRLTKLTEKHGHLKKQVDTLSEQSKALDDAIGDIQDKKESRDEKEEDSEDEMRFRAKTRHRHRRRPRRHHRSLRKIGALNNKFDVSQLSEERRALRSQFDELSSKLIQSGVPL